MDVIKRPIPFEKGKVIMYTGLLVKPVITDYVIVACCYRIGTYLAQIRKDHQDWVTDGRFRMLWDQMPARGGYEGEDFRLICAPDKPKNSIDELILMKKFFQEIYD